MSNEIQFRFAAELEQLRGLRQNVRNGLAALGVNEESTERLVLVVDEIATNAIEHGEHYRSGRHELCTRIALVKQRIRFEFVDPDMPEETVTEMADEFAWNRGVAPALQLERGRGMFLIREFLTDLEVSVSGRTGGMRLQGWLVE